MSTLFRKQVVEKRRQRLYGDIVISDSRINSVFVLLMGAFSVALILWAVTANYSRTAQVTGTIVTSRPYAKVFAARSGILERLYVRDGMHVEKGQPIAFIGVDVRDGARRGAAGDSLVALQRQGETIEAQLNAEDRTVRERRTRLIEALRSNYTEKQSLRSQIATQAAIVRSTAEALERIMPVVEKGFISQFEVDRRRQTLLSQRQQAEQLNQQLAQLQARNSELEGQISLLPVEHDRKSAELRGQMQVVTQQKSRASVEIGYTILAPIEGRVTALQASVGRSADPRIPMMALVPEQSQFEAELFAPSRSAGFIRDGQHVRIMYDAFPYKQFGSFDGEVIGMSHTAFAPTELDVPMKLEESVYRVRVRLNQQTVPAFGRVLSLQLGMTLSANVILERRSFLDWLLQPLSAVRNRA